jgi:hypothetical protein
MSRTPSGTHCSDWSATRQDKVLRMGLFLD